MEHIDVGDGVVKLKVKLKGEVVNLLLEKLNNGVALDNHCITLEDLILSVGDGCVSLCDNLIFSSDRGLELFNLSNLLVNILVMTLSHASQLVHTTVLKYLIVVLCIHESDHST
jgi:hypothetical protein